MSAELEVVGLTVVSGTDNWSQPKEEAVDVSAYTEGAIMLTAFGGTIANKPGSTQVWLQTAVDNSDDRYADLAMIANISFDPSPSIPDSFYIYMQGAGPGGTPDAWPGFARYLRIRVAADDNSSSLTFDVKAIMKP